MASRFAAAIRGPLAKGPVQAGASGRALWRSPLTPRRRQYADPSVEDTKKFCVSLRKSAKEERVLMYYNGHGVPKPTASGEIWVFNKGSSGSA